jgi:hypothetical protein
MKNQEKETPAMKVMAKVATGFIVLVVLLPALIRWLSELLIPFVFIALMVVVVRVVWFYTRV